MCECFLCVICIHFFVSVTFTHLAGTCVRVRMCALHAFHTHVGHTHAQTHSLPKLCWNTSATRVRVGAQCNLGLMDVENYFKRLHARASQGAENSRIVYSIVLVCVCACYMLKFVFFLFGLHVCVWYVRVEGAASYRLKVQAYHNHSPYVPDVPMCIARRECRCKKYEVGLFGFGMMMMVLGGGAWAVEEKICVGFVGTIKEPAHSIVIFMYRGGTYTRVANSISGIPSSRVRCIPDHQYPFPHPARSAAPVWGPRQKDHTPLPLRVVMERAPFH